MNIQSLVHYLFEAYHLKTHDHCGVRLAHVPNPDSLAEHVLLATQIAYFLADMEQADRAKVVEMMLFHDNAEIRIGDINKLQQSYLESEKSEVKGERLRRKRVMETEAFEDQTKFLPEFLQQVLRQNFNEMEQGETLEARVVKDADLLEQAFQIQIFKQQGRYDALEAWLLNVEKALQTVSAQEVFKKILVTSPNEWLMQVRREKGI